MRSEALDFTHRAELSERMDEPCTYEQFRDCLRSLRISNIFTANYRPTLRWLEQFRGYGRRLHIVDVGCGGGDMLRAVERWALRSGVRLQLTGVDLNPHAAHAAREFGRSPSRIEWVTGDVYSVPFTTAPDLIISSLFTHHLSEAEIVRFVRWMEQAASMAWFISDLHRHALPYHVYRVFATVFRLHPFVRHDGPVSVRRGFREDDWTRMLADAGVTEANVFGMRPARLCVSRVRRHG